MYDEQTEVLVVGGNFGKNYINTLLGLGVTVYGATTTRNENLVEALEANYFYGPRWLENFRLANASCTRTVVATPVPTHAKMIKALIKNGFTDILCEKPLTYYESEVLELLKLATKHSVKIQTAYLLSTSAVISDFLRYLKEEEKNIDQIKFIWKLKQNPGEFKCHFNGINIEITSHALQLAHHLLREISGSSVDFICENFTNKVKREEIAEFSSQSKAIKRGTAYTLNPITEQALWFKINTTYGPVSVIVDAGFAEDNERKLEIVQTDGSLSFIQFDSMSSEVDTFHPVDILYTEGGLRKIENSFDKLRDLVVNWLEGKNLTSLETSAMISNFNEFIMTSAEE